MEYHQQTLQAIKLLQGNPLFLNAVCRTLEGEPLTDYEREFFVKNLQHFENVPRIQAAIQHLKKKDEVVERRHNLRFVAIAVFLALLTTGYVICVVLANSIDD
ncbi:hypothetical protein L596_028441 [Steinernema carpocapsae]|uniref:Uncharacterized protein n=1 Tax=Steinernema carpocapsae TaxID=34508 RepID=A0A4U5LYI0_STECR|nr:hypothetical protein L596_028441 [Steinernema carpocapsae]